MTYQDTLISLGLQDENLVVLTAENRAAVRSVPEALGERFIDVGICEQTMIGMAAGLALRGRRPVAHALAAFLTMRAFEFIRTDVGIARLPVKLVGGVPGFLSEANGPTHQAIEDIALMRTIPNMQIVCPADEEELAHALPSILAAPGPCYVRHTAAKAIIEHTPFEFGVAETVSDGDDVAILTYGPLLAEAVRALDILQSKGISVRLLNMRSLRPVDEAAIAAAATAAEVVVTLEDHFVTGGLYTIVAETLVQRGIRAQVVPIGLDARWFRPGLLADVLRHEGFTGERIADRVLDVLERRKIALKTSS
ncbi:MAG TPA: transketolase C-terminal domain-containing protein [Polyangiaceae bacterium]|nr:transketolase C-terminal domain-containing protein [Polyangiaceae bacterium]